jgi:hypothetical protein
LYGGCMVVLKIGGPLELAEETSPGPGRSPPPRSRRGAAPMPRAPEEKKGPYYTVVHATPHTTLHINKNRETLRQRKSGSSSLFTYYLGSRVISDCHPTRTASVACSINSCSRRPPPQAIRPRPARDGRRLGETGPLSQGGQAGRKALSIRHINGTEVRKKRPRGFNRAP